jgi:Xaa-Pro dipeptidase
MGRDGLDAVIVSGNEYTGFEGAVTYMSGFVIVHRYAYVLLPLEGEPSIVFPREATFVGEHATTWIDEQLFVDRPGEWLADRVKGKRVGVYGLDYVMTVRDYRVLSESAEVVAWDEQFDHARAVKSELELESVRDSVRINTEGFWVFLEHFAPGKSEREILAPCEQYFVEQGCGRLTMDMVLTGPNGSALPEFKIAGDYRIKKTDMVLPSLEVAGPGGHWVEVSRAICPGRQSEETKQMLEAYEEYYEAARGALRAGATAHDVHRAVARGFVERGFTLGHVTGHSIGMTMIEWPKIGEGDETELREGMVFSMHPHAISEDGEACLYMQDTWLVTAGGGEPLARLPMRIFDGTEVRL